MRLRAHIFLSALALTGLDAAAHAHPPAVSYSGGDGSSLAKAVVIVASDEKSAVLAEWRYVGRRYPGFRYGPRSNYLRGKRVFERVGFSTGGRQRRLYFDISQSYGKGPA